MDRKDSLSRAQLIGGILATGALISCGGANVASDFSNEPMLPGSVRKSSARLVSVDEIFSDPFFKNIDKQALVKAFDPSARIEANHRGYFAQVGQVQQNGKTITHIPSAGITITKPGKYRLANDIVWRPNDVQCSAITIKGSNVTLDLGGFTLRAVVADKSQQITGILVDGPAVDVTITNGTLANLPEYGILATSVYGLKISSVNVTGICMNNLATRFLTPSGIEVDSSVNVAISNCRVEGLNVTTDSCAGIFLQKTIQATVANCRAVGLTNHDGAIIAFSAINCSQVTTSGCRAETLRSHFNGNTLASGHTVLGFCPIFCWNMTYVDCSSSGLTGCCDDCHGMSVFLDGMVTVTGFRGDNVVDGVSPSHSGAKATGLEVYGVNVTIVNSTVSKIKAINPQDRQSTGFSAWGLNIQFEGCKASDVTVEGKFIKDAHAEGFGWAPDPRQPLCSTGAVAVAYTDCTAIRCEVGFDTWYHIDSKWTRPITKDCKTGILVEPSTTKRTISCDPCSECQPGFDVTIANIASGNTVNGKPIS